MSDTGDYISREAAIEEQKRFCGYLDNDMLNRLEIAIGRIPAADVRPVVREKWMPYYDYTEFDFVGSTPIPEPRKFQDGWQCSLCGEHTLSETNYCPNCGAWMEES